MIARLEPWGAWVRLETTPALVALDRDGAAALGLDGGALWQGDAQPAPSPPVEVHLAVTAKCAAGCEGCYLDARPDGEEPAFEELVHRLDALRTAGVFTVAFGGGEPTTRDDLAALAAEATRRGLVAVLTTSGFGLTREKALSLRAFAQVNVSYDGEGDDYARVRGIDGARAAEAAITALAEAGVRVGVNVVLTQATYARLGATLRRARALGAVEAQLLRYKPAGRAATLDYLARRLTPEQASSVPATLRALSAEHAGALAIRIDCAMVPFLSADREILAAPERLASLGVFGCEAGQALAAVKVDGRVAPCSFTRSSEVDVWDLGGDLSQDPVLARFRSYVDAPEEPCASCPLRPVCKGGCKVVSSFLDGVHGPDPECPRVRELGRSAHARPRTLLDVLT